MNQNEHELSFTKQVNKFVMVFTIIIDICTVAGYSVATLTGTFPIGKLMLIFAVMIVGLIISGITAKKNYEMFRYVEMIAFAILYMIALFEAGMDHMYVLVFPIITMYVLYFDYKFIKIASFVFAPIESCFH